MMNKVSTTGAGMRYGLMAGLILIVMALVFYVTDLQDYSTGKQNIYSQILSWVIQIGAVILAIKYYKDTNDGMMSYGQGVVTSLMTGLFMGIVSAIWIYVFFNFIDTGALDLMVDATRENMMKNNGMTEDQVESAMGITKTLMSPPAMAGLAILFTPIITLVIGLVASAFIKNDQYAA